MTNEQNNMGLAPKHVGEITEFSRNMLLQSTPEPGRLILNDFAKVLAESLDNAAAETA